jgi:AraC family transcriptional regulator
MTHPTSQCGCDEHHSHSLQAFFGQARRQIKASSFRLTMLDHAPDTVMPAHDHELALVSCLVNGSYRSRTRTADFELACDDMLYCPPEFSHSDDIGKSGARFFCIEITADAEMKLPNTHHLFREELTIYAARRLLSEFLGEQDQFALDCLGAELVGTLTAPAWKSASASQMTLVADRLCAHPSGNVRLAEIAADLGTHATTLTRQFRAAKGISMGEYRQIARARRANGMVLTGQIPLAAIAADCGYADQSHMTRDFLRRFGQTPSALGQALQHILQ